MTEEFDVLCIGQANVDILVRPVKKVDFGDDDAMRAFFQLCRLEGISPAVESSHALAYAIQYAKEHGTGSVLVNLSGRGDKDIDFVKEQYGYGEELLKEDK